ncbi:24554_t:CDS:2 [Gigaspora rosea]|nr:24554_t:CDS:2 [Gigaspora rosea]
MVKRKIRAKLREYNNVRKKVAKERSEMADMLKEKDNFEQNSEKYSSFSQEECSSQKECSNQEEFNDQEYKGVDEEERTQIHLLAVPL